MSATDVHNQWIKEVSGGRFDPAARTAITTSGSGRSDGDERRSNGGIVAEDQEPGAGVVFAAANVSDDHSDASFARKLGQHADKIYELSKKIAQTGEKAIQLGQSANGDHDKLIAAGEAANQCADNIGKLAAELKNLAGKSSRFRSCAERFANRTGQMTNYAGKLLNATQLILDGCDASLATDDFLASSSEQNVHAWAHSICKVFDDAGDAIDIIPDGALPDFMLKYWKALFAAPSTFISAFESIMKAQWLPQLVPVTPARRDHSA
jgi:hypothetical protein